MEEDEDQKGKQMALQSLIARLGHGDNSKPADDPDPDAEMDSGEGGGLLSSDKELAAKMKKKGGSSGGGGGGGMGGLGSMMGGGGGGGAGGAMGDFDIGSLAGLFA